MRSPWSYFVADRGDCHSVQLPAHMALCAPPSPSPASPTARMKNKKKVGAGVGGYIKDTLPRGSHQFQATAPRSLGFCLHTHVNRDTDISVQRHMAMIACNDVSFFFGRTITIVFIYFLLLWSAVIIRITLVMDWCKLVREKITAQCPTELYLCGTGADNIQRWSVIMCSQKAWHTSPVFGDEREWQAAPVSTDVALESVWLSGCGDSWTAVPIDAATEACHGGGGRGTGGCMFTLSLWSSLDV